MCAKFLSWSPYRFVVSLHYSVDVRPLAVWSNLFDLFGDEKAPNEMSINVVLDWSYVPQSNSPLFINLSLIVKGFFLLKNTPNWTGKGEPETSRAQICIYIFLCPTLPYHATQIWVRLARFTLVDCTRNTTCCRIQQRPQQPTYHTKVPTALFGQLCRTSGLATACAMRPTPPSTTQFGPGKSP